MDQTSAGAAELATCAAREILREFASELDDAEQRMRAQAQAHAGMECAAEHEARADTLRDAATGARQRSHTVRVDVDPEPAPQPAPAPEPEPAPVRVTRLGATVRAVAAVGVLVLSTTVVAAAAVGAWVLLAWLWQVSP